MAAPGYGSGVNNGTDPITGLPIVGTTSTDPTTGKPIAATNGTKDYENNAPPQALGGSGPQNYDDFGKQRVADLLNPNSTESQAFQVANTNDRNAKYAAAQTAINNRTAPTTDYTAANADSAAAQQARGLQNTAANMYLQQAQGNGPSVAQAQFAQAQDAVRQQNASMAASARGGGLARSSAQDQAIQQNSQMGQQNAAASAALRAQEIATATQGLAGTSGNIRAQDIGSQAQDAQQAQYGSNLALQNRSQNDAASSFYEQQQTALDTQNYQGQLAQQQSIMDANAADQQQQSINNGQQMAANARTDSYLGAAASTGGAILGTAIAPGAGTIAGAAAGNAAYSGWSSLYSDKRVKEDIRSADDKIKAFLDAMSAHDYSYKDPGTPGQAPGRHVSPMAQELTQSEVGARLVKETPNGIKMIEYGPEAMASAFAAMAHLNKRMNEMESKKSGKSKGAR